MNGEWHGGDKLRRTELQCPAKVPQRDGGVHRAFDFAGGFADECCGVQQPEAEQGFVGGGLEGGLEMVTGAVVAARLVQTARCPSARHTRVGDHEPVTQVARDRVRVT